MITVLFPDVMPYLRERVSLSADALWNEVKHNLPPMAPIHPRCSLGSDRDDLVKRALEDVLSSLDIAASQVAGEMMALSQGLSCIFLLCT